METVKKSKFLIKSLNANYIDEVMEIENKCWPESLRASKKNILSRLKYFPEGTVGCFTIEGKLIGFATSQIIHFEPYIKIDYVPDEKWMELDNKPNSNILDTMQKDGNALHLVSACVLKEYRGNNLWLEMITYRENLAKLIGLKYLVIFSRLKYMMDNQPIKEDPNIDDIIEYITKGNDFYIEKLKKYEFKVNGLKYKPEDVTSGKHWVLLYKIINKRS